MIDILTCAKDATTIGNYDKEFNRVAKIHKYWSRKPFNLVEDCILTYSQKGQVVLDPFCGSGSTGLGTILNHRKYIGYDLNPTAIFITNSTLDLEFNCKEFSKELAKLETDIKRQIMDLYSCGNDTYIIYGLIGKNTNDYNAVVGDYAFSNKRKIQITTELLFFEPTFPEDTYYPDENFPTKFYKDRFSYKGIHKVSEMFTKRNLYALSILYNYIEEANFKYKDLLRLAFSNTLLHVSKLKSENVRPLSVNNYWLPDDCIEENVIWRFLDRAKNVAEAKKQVIKRAKSNGVSSAKYELYNQSSINLENISNNSIDYIITDPPYGDAIQYSELSFMWNCWLKNTYQIKDEVIINPEQNKGANEFKNQIHIFINNAYRVLKENGKFTLCFQNKDVSIWLDMILHIKSIGFALEDIRIYDTFGSPYNKHWAKFSPKADLYVTFSKSHRRIENTENITPEQIISEIFSKCDPLQLDMNHCYDLFVASAINEIFSGKQIINAEKWNLKQIVNIYEQKFRTIEKRNTTSVQCELQFTFD